MPWKRYGKIKLEKFTHINARSLDQAVTELKRYNGGAALIAGGTDLLGKMKDRILPVYPEAVINLKTIPDLDYIEYSGGVLKIGALTRLSDIAAHPVIQSKYTALAEAAGRTASPHLREMGTLGGNICQDVRCWYYRNPNNRFTCLRKGGGRCYAINGDNRYHSIFGGSVKEGCFAVHPSDTAPALNALDARIVTTRRTIGIDDFFKVGVSATTVLDMDEVVTEIQVPEADKNSKSAFLKFALRKSIDFPIVNCAAMIGSKDGRIAAVRICLNAVYVVPLRATAAENALLNQPLNEPGAGAAADLAVSGAKPMSHNGYMVRIARTLIKRTVLNCG
jgi:xanthine dehydrogenase YagS FAD-binding subunit